MEASTEKFLRDCENAAAEIRELALKGEFIPIFCHHDPDGLAAGAIIAKAMHRLGGNFLLHVIDRIDEKVLNEIMQVKSKTYIFAEIGSGYLDYLRNIPLASKIILMDHHKPIDASLPNLIHVNPSLHGIDGAKDISGSGVCYLVAKKLSLENVDLSYLAVVGALGDLQDKGKGRCLQNLNLEIVHDAESKGLLAVQTDLLFYGRETRPLHQAIATTTNPFIPGLSGEEDKCLGFLVNLGIRLKDGERWRCLADLSHDEKQRIFSQITIHLSSKGFREKTIFELIGCVYVLLKEDKGTPLRDGREFASMFNACSKMGKPSVALGICFGNRKELLTEAQTLLNEYRKVIGEYMKILTGTAERIIELENIYIIKGHDVIDEKMLSPIASILSNSAWLTSEKPLIALTKMGDDKSKVSARTSQSLVDSGLHLGLIMQTAGEKVGGKGGGHNIAAGAVIPSGKEKEFIDAVKQMIKEALQS